MINKAIKFSTLFAIFFSASVMWHNIPTSIDESGWQILVLFTTTVVVLISGLFSMGLCVLMSLSAASILGIIDSKTLFAGYSASVIWLVVLAFFIARAIINTGLGKRIAYLLIARFGGSINGLAYSMIFAECAIAPLIPSATARSSGIFLPIGRELIDKYMEGHPTSSKSVGGFMTMLMYHTNIITSTMFLTAMAGNPFVVDIAKEHGIDITWNLWAKFAVIPGMISLILLPHILSKVFKLKRIDSQTGYKIKNMAQNSLEKMGKMQAKEIAVVFILFCLILSWIFESIIGVSTTVTAMIGVCAMLIIGAMSWNDVIEEKAAWNTFVWFGGIITLSDKLTSSGSIVWLIDNIQSALGGISVNITILLAFLLVIYMHYMFASTTGYMVAVLGVFLSLFISLGMDPTMSAFSLSFATILSSGLTHYGSAAAPGLLGMGHMSVGQWWKKSGLITNLVIIVWAISCFGWWNLIALF